MNKVDMLFLGVPEENHQTQRQEFGDQANRCRNITNDQVGSQREFTSDMHECGIMKPVILYNLNTLIRKGNTVFNTDFPFSLSQNHHIHSSERELRRQMYVMQKFPVNCERATDEVVPSQVAVRLLLSVPVRHSGASH